MEDTGLYTPKLVHHTGDLPYTKCKILYSEEGHCTTRLKKYGEKRSQAAERLFDLPKLKPHCARAAPGGILPTEFTDNKIIDISIAINFFRSEHQGRIAHFDFLRMLLRMRHWHL